MTYAGMTIVTSSAMPKDEALLVGPIECEIKVTIRDKSLYRQWQRLPWLSWRYSCASDWYEEADPAAVRATTLLGLMRQMAAIVGFEFRKAAQRPRRVTRQALVSGHVRLTGLAS